MVVRPKIMFLNICKFHLQFWQMCKLFANKLFSLNIYSYSSVWIIMVHSNFDAKNLHFICLRISPQIFAIVQKFALDNFRDQQFRNLLCEWEWVVMVVFTGNAVQVEVPPGMVWLRNWFTCLSIGHCLYHTWYDTNIIRLTVFQGNIRDIKYWDANNFIYLQQHIQINS